MSSCYIKSLFVLAQFVNCDESVDLYPGQIQYFFTHTINLADGPVDHKLAYIRWYRPVNSAEIRFHFSIDKTETCNVELWNSEFYPIQRECFIPVHNIFSRFVPVSYKISNRQNLHEYLAVIPLNCKYNI